MTFFVIANRFGIRHNDAGQKTDYDHDLLLNWMFYYYLNTISLVVKKLAPQPPPPIVVTEKKPETELLWDSSDLEDLPF